MANENYSTSSRRAACCRILGIEPYATREEIKTAYKHSALKWHPDRQKSDKDYAKDRFVEIHEAYQTLMGLTPMSPPMSRNTSGFPSPPPTPASKPSDFYSQSAGSTSSWTSSRPPSNTSTPRTSTDDLPTPKPSKHARTHSKTSTDGFRRARTRTLSRVKKSDRAQFTRTESSNSGRSHNSSKSHQPSSRHHHSGRSHKSDRPEPSSSGRSHPSSDKGKEKPSSSKHSHSRSERSPGRSDRSDRDDRRRHHSHRHRSRSRSRSRDRPERSTSSKHSDKGKEREKGKGKDAKVEVPEVKKEKAEKKSTNPHKSDKDSSSSKERVEKVEEEVDGVPPQVSEPPLRPPIIGIPLRPSCAPDTNNSDWIFPLPLTLEELYSGTNYRFQITRQLKTPPEPDSNPTSTPKSTSSTLDDEPSTSTIHVNVDIPPGGYKNQTQMRFEGLGNQKKSDGTFQDIVFVIQEVFHDRFIRIQDDLVARIELTWDEALQKEDVILVDGLDGAKVEVPIPKVPDDSKETRIPKAGMPTRNAKDEVVGRGDLVVRWEFVFPQKHSSSKWRALKSKFSWQSPKAFAS